MTIHLPDDLEQSILAAVHRGRFDSVDDAMTLAAQLLLSGIDQQPTVNASSGSISPSLGFIGALRDDVDLLDQAVEHAMNVREERPWRSSPLE